MHYLVGDIQGCASALDRLLDEIAFSPSRDHLYVLGDLVNRGPGSLATLRRLRGLGAAASCVLGNHDWHLLAVAAGVRPRHRSDTLDDILDAPDREDWLAWVRARRMAVFEQGWLMLHAGVVPQWDLATTLQGKGPYTVFAPTDQAFQGLPKGTLDTLLKPANKDQLTSVLTYHVVPGKVTAAQLKDGQELTTVNGEKLTVSIDGKTVKVGDATVTKADVPASNGVVHVIDTVLQPAS